MVSKSPELPPVQQLHSVDETRKLLGGIGKTTFYSEVAAGKIELVKIGSRSFATSDAIARYIEGLRKAAA